MSNTMIQTHYASLMHVQVCCRTMSNFTVDDLPYPGPKCGTARLHDNILIDISAIGSYPLYVFYYYSFEHRQSELSNQRSDEYNRNNVFVVTKIYLCILDRLPYLC